MSQPVSTELQHPTCTPEHVRIAGLRILENINQDMRSPSARPVWRMMRTVYLDEVAPRGRAGITIGRSPPCDIVIPHPTVSARHCRIERLGANLLAIEDCGSSNGVYLTSHGPYNPRRVEWGKIALGCYVYLGDVALVPVDTHGAAMLTGGRLGDFMRNARSIYGSESQIQRHLGLTGTLFQRLSRFWRTATGNVNRER